MTLNFSLWDYPAPSLFLQPFLFRMIQRIQSLYLLLAAACMGTLLAAPLYKTVSDGASFAVYLGGLVQETPEEKRAFR